MSNKSRRPLGVLPEPLERRRLLAGVPLQVVAATGQSAPGLPGLTLLDQRGDPVINNAGDVVSTRSLAGPGVTEANDTASFVFPHAGSGRAPVAFREGDLGPLPAGEGSVLGDTGVQLNDAGDILLFAEMRRPGSSEVNQGNALFVGPPDAPQLLIHTGDPVPPLPGEPRATFTGLTASGRFTDDGGAWLPGAATTGTENFFADLYDPPGPAPLRRLRVPVPGPDGQPTGRYLQRLRVLAAAPDGRVVISGYDEPEQPPHTRNFVLLGGTPDALRVVARYGEQAPGLDPGMLFASVGPASINSAGQFVFSASVGREPLDAFVVPDLRFLNYLVDGDTIRPIGDRGTPAPAPGTQFGTTQPFAPLIDSAGRVTFMATYSDSGGVPFSPPGVFTYQAGTYRLIAQWGQQAPDLPPGVVMSRVPMPASNDAGQFAFIAGLAGPGVVSGVNDFAIFASDATGRVRLVFRRGDAVDVDGQPRATTWVEANIPHAAFSPWYEVSNSNDGLPSAFNDHGQLAFRAEYAGGSAVVVADVNAGVTRVAGRHVFYNHSGFDGNDPAANANDDGAIAPDKRALPAGGGATFSNVTSYARGINGVMIDVANLPPARTPNVDDFTFLAGRSAAAADLSSAPAPSQLTVRRGAGVNGSDRITLVWPDGAIENQWLQVTVKATPATGLSSADTFAYGNLVAETGDTAATSRSFAVTPADYARASAARTAAASITNLFDFNRDRRVNIADLMTARAAYRRSLPTSPTIVATAAPTAAPTRAPARRSPYFQTADLLA